MQGGTILICGGGSLVAVEVVADGALVEQEDGPGVMAVERVAVVGERRMQDLDDALHRERTTGILPERR
ncbi:MAG: hypothetical protein R2695_09955 [Acidimicrobiales bacterium]